MSITQATSLAEIAALVSQAQQSAGIDAVLGGGGAMTQYSDNEYMTTNLDFVTIERNKRITPILAEFGFEPRGREYAHPKSRFFVEFPPGPLSFGDRYVDNNEATFLETQYGPIRIITPTQCVMDRLAWFIHGNDKQARDQALMVAKRQNIDWKTVFEWAEGEGIDPALIQKLQTGAEG